MNKNKTQLAGAVMCVIASLLFFFGPRVPEIPLSVTIWAGGAMLIGAIILALPEDRL